MVVVICPEELAASITAAAIAIARDRSEEELALLASVFTQLADTLSTIAAARALCEYSETAANNGKR